MRDRYNGARCVCPEDINRKAHIFHPDAPGIVGLEYKQHPLPVWEARAAREPLFSGRFGIGHIDNHLSFADRNMFYRRNHNRSRAPSMPQSGARERCYYPKER